MCALCVCVCARARVRVQRLGGRHAVLGRDLGNELVLEQRGAAVPRLEGVGALRGEIHM